MIAGDLYAVLVNKYLQHVPVHYIGLSRNLNTR